MTANDMLDDQICRVYPRRIGERAHGMTAGLRFAMAFAIGLGVSPAFAQSEPGAKCSVIADAPDEERIEACTSVIESRKYGQLGLVRAYYIRAGTYVKKREFELAAADYSAMIEINPRNFANYAYRAYAYFQLGDFDRAIADYGRTIELNPRSRYAWISRGTSYSKKADFDHAISDYTEAMRLGHQDEQKSANGNAQSRSRDNETLPPSVDGQPTRLMLADGYAFDVRGAAYFAKGDPDRAIADYDRAIQFNPKDESAYVRRAAAFRMRGEMDRAFADCAEALQLNSRNKFANYCRGITYLENGDLADAMADFDRVVEFDPKDASAYRVRGVAFAQYDMFDKALADLDQAVLLDRKSPETYRARASAYLQSGSFEKALADLDQSVLLAPKESISYRARGTGYLHAGMFEKSLTDLDQSVLLASKDAGAYRARGAAYFQSGTFAKSLADFDQAQLLTPNNAYVWLWRNMAAARADDASRASRATTELDMNRWPAPIVRLVLGELSSEAVLRAADDTSAGIKRRRTCEANFYIGELALQRREKAEAARSFKLALNDCPKSFVEYWSATTELKALETRP